MFYIDQMEQGNNLEAIVNKGRLMIAEMEDDLPKVNQDLQLMKDPEWTSTWCTGFSTILRCAKDRFNSTALEVEQEHRLMS